MDHLIVSRKCIKTLHTLFSMAIDYLGTVDRELRLTI